MYDLSNYVPTPRSYFIILEVYASDCCSFITLNKGHTSIQKFMTVKVFRVTVEG